MNRLDLHPNSDTCRGKKSNDSSAYVDECQVIHFPWVKKNQYAAILEIVTSNLVGYIRRYFLNWQNMARDRFTSFTQNQKMDEDMETIFWNWFASNYRFYRDISPIIDFYLAENEDKIEESYITVLNALKKSYLSLYTVVWIKNNTVLLRDIFLNRSFVIERNFGSLTRIIETGNLLLCRLVQIGNMSVCLDKPVIIESEQMAYLKDEVLSWQRQENIEDTEFFLREYAEVLCGLILDLRIGIRRNRLKSRSLKLNNHDARDAAWKISKYTYFSILEKNGKWIKIGYERGSCLFKRAYLGENYIIVVAEERTDLENITHDLSAVMEELNWRESMAWAEGYCFGNEEEAEEVLTEIMHDNYMEEWLNSPQQELEGLTPLQAVSDIKGRVLLEHLLDNLKLVELRARSRDEYFISTDAIRKKLNLDKNKLGKELLHPEAIKIKVERYRSRQELSPYVTAYNWLNEEHRRVAVTVFDIFNRNILEGSKLAWILYIWNEFAGIYNPKIYKTGVWVAALEYSYCTLSGARVTYSATGKRFGIATSLISKNAQLIIRHFTSYPVDFNVAMVDYPFWDDMDNSEMIKSYEEVWQHLQVFTYAVKGSWGKDEDEARHSFYAAVNPARKFWNESTSKTFEHFFKNYYMLDCPDESGTTIANAFWENQAKRFPPYLKTAAFNLMMSYPGAYRIMPKGENELWFEDTLTGAKYEVAGNFGDRVHDKIVAGMIGITRLLPLGERLWVNDPMLIVLPDWQEVFEKNLQILMENYHPYDVSDFNYLKRRGENLLKAYIISLDELEQSAVNLMNQPLQIEWEAAGVINPDQVLTMLKQNHKFKLLHDDEEKASFIWISSCINQNSQWGYILLKEGNIFITMPPGKDRERFVKDLRRVFKAGDMVLAFSGYKGSYADIKYLENNLIKDLAQFFNSNPDLSLVFLRQDDLEDEEKEWEQGIFLLKLGSMLMNYIRIARKT